MTTESERDSGSLRITVKDVFHAVNGVSSDVGEIKGALQTLTADHANLKQSAVDHEARLRRLERWAYAIPTTGITALASALIALWAANAR